MNNSVITAKKMRNILEVEFGYKPSKVLYDLLGDYVWLAPNQPLDFTSKTIISTSIYMGELVSVYTETQLRTLIQSKLK